MTPAELDAAYVVEPLSSDHDRRRFSCGKEALDRYLREQASQDARRHVAATFVARPRGSHVVAGYYTLAATSVQGLELPDDLARKLPHYPKLPATLLGGLARDTSHARRRLGEYLLLHALSRSLTHSSEIASIAVIVDAIDDEAVSFYRAYEFVPLPGQPMRLFLPTASIVRALVSDTP